MTRRDFTNVLARYPTPAVSPLGPASGLRLGPGADRILLVIGTAPGLEDKLPSYAIIPHHYDGLDMDIVWQVIPRNLPVLLRAIEPLLPTQEPEENR